MRMQALQTGCSSSDQTKLVSISDPHSLQIVRLVEVPFKGLSSLLPRPRIGQRLLEHGQPMDEISELLDHAADRPST